MVTCSRTRLGRESNSEEGLLANSRLVDQGPFMLRADVVALHEFLGHGRKVRGPDEIAQSGARRFVVYVQCAAA